MAPEGMVHALELVHGLLVSGGALVDIHPTGDPPPAYAVQQAGQTTFVAWLHETDELVEYAQAEKALSDVVERGLFRLEAQDRFNFVIEASDYAELRQFLVDNWSDILFVPDDEERIRSSELAAGPGCHVTLTENVLVTRYRRCDPGI